MRKGFSVPEMLAVVAIIAIIISILIPVYIKHRVTAYQAICANNNRQLLQASITYSVNFQQWLPFANWGSQEGTWNNPGWLHRSSLGSAAGTQRNGQLWPYLKEDKIYRCPQDEPPFIANSTHRITSYLMNGAFCGFGGSPTIIYKSHRFAPSAIMFWEVDSLSSAGYYNDGSSFPNEVVTQRHLTGLTVGSRDGHTEWFTYAQYWAEEAKGPGRLWCKPDSANGH